MVNKDREMMRDGLAAYQEAAAEFATYVHAETGSDEALSFLTMSLASEVGEVAAEVRMLLAVTDSIARSRIEKKIRRELGDVLWCVSSLLSEMDSSLSNTALRTLESLEVRGRKKDA